jgi:hypothetical protein
MQRRPKRSDGAAASHPPGHFKRSRRPIPIARKDAYGILGGVATTSSQSPTPIQARLVLVERFSMTGPSFLAPSASAVERLVFGCKRAETRHK